MPDAAMLRDSTQILLPEPVVEDLGDELDDRFTLSFLPEEMGVRVVGSPVEIKQASQFLTRNGVSIE